MKFVCVSLALMGLVACHVDKPGSQLHDESSGAGAKSANPFVTGEPTEDATKTVAARIGYAGGDGHPDNGKCIGCHQNFNNIDVLDRLYNSTTSAYACFNKGVSTQDQANSVLNCLAKLGGDSTDLKNLEASALGFMSAGVEHKVFKDLFKTAGREAEYEDFKASAGMPLGKKALADEDFEKLLSWVIYYYPGLPDFLKHDGPHVCESPAETRMGSKLREHVRRMSEGGLGWEYVNLSRGLSMFACPDQDKHHCFTQQSGGKDIFALADEWKAFGLPGHIRILHQYDKETSYWIRSSADGRFVASGGDPSIILDLSEKLKGRAARKIEVEALYDPGFLPDNSAFIFQGEEHGSRICEQSLLDHTDIVTIDFMQPGCSKGDLKIGLYQAIGSNLDNGEIRSLAGYYASDDGYATNRDIAPLFGKAAAISVDTIRRVDDSSFEKVSSVNIRTPYHGSWMMAPSNQMATSIVSASKDGKARHGGYRLFLMDEGFGASGELPDWKDESTGLLCTQGGEKPNISFDERMMAFYRYAKQDHRVGSVDSSADIYVFDLLRGQEPIAITAMPKGYYAQFPHYRSDGWLYFTVYNAHTNERFVAATDVSLYFESAAK